MTRLLTTVFYIGCLRPAPGTWGSAAAIPMVIALHLAGGFPAVAAGAVVVLLVGLWAIGRALVLTEDPDPSEIVIDEVAGMFIALLPVSAGAWHVGAPVLALWPGFLTGFLAFRLFDIWKPGPVGWADRRGGMTGVMFDDLIAGGMAAVVVLIGAGISHGLMKL
jgi:phosphatidylglycerophosphatase A